MKKMGDISQMTAFIDTNSSYRNTYRYAIPFLWKWTNYRKFEPWFFIFNNVLFL